MTMLFVKGAAKAHPVLCWSASHLRAAKQQLKKLHEDSPYMLYGIMDSKGHWVDSNSDDFTMYMTFETPALYKGHLHGLGGKS